MTDRYSVENYLVCEQVLEEILKTEFPCHGKPHVRERIITAFSRVYNEFLSVTRDLNYRIFVARALGVEITGRLTEKLNPIALVELTSVSAAATLAEAVVLYSRVPSVEELNGLEAKFDALDPRTRYRGKFSILFFRRWLDMLALEYADRKRGFFDGIDDKARPRSAELTLGNFAIKSHLPYGLETFVRSITG